MKRTSGGPLLARLMIFLMLFTGLSISNSLYSMEALSAIGEAVEESVSDSLETAVGEEAAGTVAKQASSLTEGVISDLKIDPETLSTALDSPAMTEALSDFSKAMDQVAGGTTEQVTSALSTNLKDLIGKLQDALPEGEKLTTDQITTANRAIDSLQGELDAQTSALAKAGEGGGGDLIPEKTGEPTTPGEPGTGEGGTPSTPQEAPTSTFQSVKNSLVNTWNSWFGKGEEEAGAAAGKAEEGAGTKAGEGAGEGAGEKGGTKPGEKTESTLGGMGMTLLSAVLFMVPQGIINSIQSKLTATAQLQTIQAPQYFGGLWFQLPSELVNQDNPQNSIFVYSQVTNPDPKKFYGNVGGTGGVQLGNIDRNNFFVPSGSGYGDCGKSGGWAQAGIPTPGFAGQMIHLNSGLEFMGNGDPVSDTFPFRTLTGDTDFANNNCTSTMTRYLETLAASVQSGQAFTESYNDMFSGAGALTSSGSFTGDKATQKNTAQLQTLAKLLYNTDSDNLLTRSFANENETAKMTSLARANQPFVLGAPVKRDPNTQDKISGGYQLQAMQATTAAQQAVLGNVIDDKTATISDAGDSVVARGLFVYQTADTPLAVGARQAMRAQGGNKAAAASQAYDYVVTFDDGFNYIPAAIPIVNQPKGGANSTKPGSVTWAPNPDVKYILSLLDNSLFDTSGVPPASMTGSNAYSILSQNKIFANAVSGLSNTLTSLFTATATALKGSAQTGPFKYGGYVLNVPTELQANQLYTTVPVYTITAAANNNKTTLESGDTDYVVALDANFKPIALPSGQQKYFASLVTSTIYDNQLVPVATPTQFDILLYTNQSSKTQTAYVATVDTAQGFLSQGAEYACSKCQSLTSPLATLYQEYQVNPYNKILSVLGDLTQAITTALQNSNDPIYSGIKSANVMPRLSNFIATNVVGSLQAAGLTPTLLQELNSQLPTDADARNQALQTIGTQVANAVTAALKGGINSGVVSGSLTSVATAASPADLLKLLNAATNKSIATAFSGLGTQQLKDVLPDSVQVIFDSLSKYLGIDAGQAYQVTLAQSGLIPVGAFYIYDSWNLAPGASSGDDQSSGGSAQPLASYFASNSALATLDQGIKTSHTHWLTWKLTNGQAGALAFEAMGPFTFTTKLIPNVVITATSLDDIKAGDFVYQSSAYPGDYFIVATALGSDNAVEGSENQYTQPFDPANPQPLLISLLSGTVYQRDPSTDQVSILTNSSGAPQQITNLSTVLSSLQSQTLRDQLNVATQAQQSTWPRYSYASFLLTIDPQDVQNNTYIYQDVTGVTTFPPALSDVDAFFVGARKLDDGSMTIGIPLENNPDYIINVATGGFYGPAGLDTSVSLPEGVQPGSLLLGQLKGSIRPELRQAIDLLTQQAAAAAQTPEDKASTAGVPQQLSSAIVTKLLSADVPYIGGGYPQLKPYNGKYYGVIGAANDTSGATVGTITDYSAQISTGTGSKSINAVVIYDANGTPTSVLEGVLQDIARKQVGVIVNSDGTQLLGVPNQHPALDLTNGTLAPFTQAATAKLTNGTYDLEQYTNTQLPGLQVIAKYTPSGSAATGTTGDIYINLFSGDQFDSTGAPLIANYPVNVNATDNSIIALLSTNTATSPMAFGIGPDNYYHAYNFYANATSQTSGAQFIELSDTPGQTEYIAITPQQLDPTASWTVRMGQQQGSGPKFTPDTYTFAPQTGANATFARAYTYVGSGDNSLIGAQGPVFQANKVSANPNYASNGTLVATGTLSGSTFTPTQLFVAPVEATTNDQSGIDFTSLPADGYIGLTNASMATVQPAGGASTATQAPAAGQPLVFNAPASTDGTQINYPVKFYNNLVDTNTGAQYIAIQDQNGVHFYTPHYQTTDAQTLQQIQQQLQLYISLAMTGDVALFKPLPPAVNLNQIQTMVDVPTDQTDAIKAFLTANTFWYDPTSQRYLYQFSQGDANEVYYSPDAMYVDLRMGVLYDQNGIPTGSSLTYPQLQILFNDKRFGLPIVGEEFDPSSYQAPQGTTVVATQGTPSDKTAVFLHYAP